MCLTFTHVTIEKKCNKRCTHFIDSGCFEDLTYIILIVFPSCFVFVNPFILLLNYTICSVVNFNVMWRSLRKFWIDDITFLAVKITRRHKNPKDVRSVYPQKSSFSLQFCDRIYTVTCAFGIHVTLYLQIIPIIHELAWGEYDTMKVIYWWAIYSGA